MVAPPAINFIKCLKIEKIANYLESTLKNNNVKLY